MRTRFRPVPLRWLFVHAPGGPRGPAAVADLLDASGRALNPKLSLERFMRAEARCAGRLLLGCVCVLREG